MRCETKKEGNYVNVPGSTTQCIVKIFKNAVFQFSEFFFFGDETARAAKKNNNKNTVDDFSRAFSAFYLKLLALNSIRFAKRASSVS